MSRQDKKIFILILLLCAPLSLRAATDPYGNSPADQFQSDLKTDQQEYRKNKEKEEKKKIIIVEPFCRNLAKSATYWNMSGEDLQKIKNNGLGFSELVKTVLISKKINKPAEDVVKRRLRGETFIKICERYKIDYKEIQSETDKIMSEVKIYGKK